MLFGEEVEIKLLSSARKLPEADRDAEESAQKAGGTARLRPAQPPAQSPEVPQILRFRLNAASLPTVGLCLTLLPSIPSLIFDHAFLTSICSSRVYHVREYLIRVSECRSIDAD